MKNIFRWWISEKISVLTVKNTLFTDESVKWQITDAISDNSTDSDLERYSVMSKFLKIH